MQRKLSNIAPAIATDVESWLRTLHDGGPRSRPRDPATVWRYLNAILPQPHNPATPQPGSRPGPSATFNSTPWTSGNRRLTIAGQTRPIADLTRGLLIEWLDYRRTRWPHTANPHLLIHRNTALGTGPGSGLWLTKAFVGTGIGLERYALHLAEMFGIGEVTAIRYAHVARQLLATEIVREKPQHG